MITQCKNTNRQNIQNRSKKANWKKNDQFYLTIITQMIYDRECLKYKHFSVLPIPSGTFQTDP